MRRILLLSAAVLMAGQPAGAAAQTNDWTGPYVGGRLGYTTQPDDRNETVLFDTDGDGTFGDTVNTISGADAFQRGFCGGAAVSATAGECRDQDATAWAVHAGFDYQVGNEIVAGLVGEYGRANIEDSVTAFSSTPAFYTFTRRLRDTAALRARAGFALGNTLVYGTGGVAYGKIRRSFTTSNSVNSFTETDGDRGSWGYRVGGGIEQKMSPGVSIGAQYLYTSLKDDGSVVRAGGANVPVSNPFILANPQGADFTRSDDRFETHSASVVVSFRF